MGTLITVRLYFTHQTHALPKYASLQYCNKKYCTCVAETVNVASFRASHRNSRTHYHHYQRPRTEMRGAQSIASQHNGLGGGVGAGAGRSHRCWCCCCGLHGLLSVLKVRTSPYSDKN